MFRKTNISHLLIRTHTCAYQGLKMLVFRKILGTYLMDDPEAQLLELDSTFSNQKLVQSTTLYFC